jgi:hypothetical protein
MKMRTTAILVVVTTFAFAAALWSGVAVAQSSTTTGDPHPAKGRTLSFDVKFSPFFLIDFGSTGVRSVSDINQSDPSKGDVSVFQDQLLKSGTVVGRDGGTCTVTSVDVRADPPIQLACNVTFELPRGTIATQGLATNAAVKHLVITGGTGAYLDAAGEATLTEFGNDTGTVVFHVAG